MKDKKNFDWMGDHSEQPLALPYIELPRLFLESACLANEGKGLSGGAMRMYLYISHNASVHKGRSHRIRVHEAADYLGKHESTIYRYLCELTESGLIKSTKESGFVYDLVCLRQVKTVKKAYGIKSSAKKRAKEAESEIRVTVESMESVLKRKLTDRERQSVIDKVLEKKRQS